MNTSISYWEKTSFYQTDVLIIGAGIVGLNTAITLKKLQPALKITLVERGALPTGASTKNAGFACFGSLSEMIEQEKNLGTDAWLAIVEKRWLGLQKLIKTVGKLGLDYEQNGGYEIFTNAETECYNTCIDQMQRYNELLMPILKQTVFQHASDKIAAFGFADIPFMIENKPEAQLHPGKMIQALNQIAAALGVHFINAYEVKNWEKTDKGYLVNGNQSAIQTQKIAVCTNAFSQKWFPDLDIKPGRGQVVVTQEIPNLMLKGTFHYEKGYYYFRNAGNRVLLGGGRNLDFKAEETTEFGETNLVQQKLRDLLQQHILPHTPFQIDYHWSGIMAFGDRLSPIIKAYDENLFIAARCNGMGIAIGSQTGTELAEIINQSI